MAKALPSVSAKPKKATPSKQPPLLPKKPPRSMAMFIAQTEAKNRFLVHCRHVIDTDEFVCVQDQSDNAFLTLTLIPVKGPSVTVSAQFFKDNFSRCSSLIRDGVAFRLTLRGSNHVVYARRHTAYKNPVDSVIDKWRARVVEIAMADVEQSALTRLARESKKDCETIRNHYQTLLRDITRMTIGHLSFEKEIMSSHRDPVPQ